MLLLWRAWHLRNNVIHGGGRETVSDSVRFLLRYEEELTDAMNGPASGSNTGSRHASFDEHSMTTKLDTDHWSAPAVGTVKMNTDASFLPISGESWAGAVARDSRGMVYISVGKHIGRCSCAEEAKAAAALMGLKELHKVYRGILIDLLGASSLAHTVAD